MSEPPSKRARVGDDPVTAHPNIRHLALSTKTFHPNGAAGVRFREKYAFAEREEYVLRVKGWIEDGKMVIVHGFRGTGKSSVAESLRSACKSSYLPLYLDFSDIVIGNPSNVFWLDMISLVLEAYKSQDPTAAERCDEFMRKCESDDDKNRFRGPTTFVALFNNTSKVFQELGEKSIVIIGDELSKFYDYMNESTLATNNVKSLVGAFRTIKEGGSRKDSRVCGAAMFGTFSATLLRSGSASPFNVVDDSGIPLLTLEEWRACVAQTAWRPEDRVLERMWELTRGYPSVLQTIARDLSMSCTPEVTTWAAFEAYERSAAFIDGVLANKSLQANLRDLGKPASRDLRASLIMNFLPSEQAVHAPLNSPLLDHAEPLTSLGFLRAIDQFSFEVASPLIRRLLMERCLQEDYRGIIPFDPPALEDGRLDILGMIQVAAPSVVKAAMQSKMIKGFGKPREIVYHLQLELLLSPWLERGAEVRCEESVPGAPRRRFDITIIDRADKSPDQGRSIILELSAHVDDTGENSITSHLEKCRNIYVKPANVSAVYYINFTTQSEAECFVPEKDDPTPLIHVRHDEDGKVLGLLVKVPRVVGLKKVPVALPTEDDKAVRKRPSPHKVVFPNLK